ncbi:hypothetical protein BKA62DRAFT_418162 [Auriculariales sp. MPI-PUGE-AT-0066]|nr:hypothetical protein BKA62DRAFT_418162 [Auriculariales sp. MPI-PUGE-AT-0066]
MAAPDFEVAALSMRTAPQLKQICKDLSIKGYSKLTKAALVEKIAAHLKGAGTQSPASAIMIPVTPVSANDEGTSDLPSPVPVVRPSQLVPKADDARAQQAPKPVLSSPPVTTTSATLDLPRHDMTLVGATVSKPLQKPKPSLKRHKEPNLAQLEPPLKRNQLSALSSAYNATTCMSRPNQTITTSVHHDLFKAPLPVSARIQSSSGSSSSPTSSSKIVCAAGTASRKTARFVPLAPFTNVNPMTHSNAFTALDAPLIVDAASRAPQNPFSQPRT